ncbi:MAG: cytochrome c [Nitrosomonadales bacterium]|nr:cytochrome c [Nitrosomonadales bacterium]
MKKYLFLALLAASAAHAEPFAKGNAESGRQLVAKYDCNSCHKGKMGGDGSAIYTRADRRVTSADILIDRMEQCSGAIGKQLTEQEKLDLAAHLNKTYYHFK